MSVVVAGSGDAFGSGGRFQTCIALGTHTLVDCGATSLVALRSQGLDPLDVRTVVISHLHADHFGGLPFLILDGQFRRRTADLTIVGPPGTRDRLERLMETCFPGSTAVTRRFTVRVVEHREREPHRDERLTVVPYEVRHASGAPAYAVRVRDEETGFELAYSGDTEWTDALLDVADGADLFLCEGYAPLPIRWHLDLESLERNRDRFGCRRLVLTHLSPTALAADRSGWETAHDGMRLG
ncbi:MBL fold metallo-hydrolase [Pseudonocardia sp. CA-107938]|uniref:MBL fold metallo-hydrolase n=1 Tax=Pseudonocardia sp. CA-107938 TaxID=3240021 RepID=UPI003D905E3E